MEAVIVIDMQHDFLDGALANLEGMKLIEPMVNYLESIKDSMDIFFTRDTHQENYLDTQEGHYLPVKHCVQGSDGWQIIGPLLPYVDNDKIIDKPTFGSLELPEYVKGYDTIHLMGVCTDICVISNAMILKAACPDAKVIVHQDLCAGVSVESHQTALNALKAVQVEVQ